MNLNFWEMSGLDSNQKMQDIDPCGAIRIGIALKTMPCNYIDVKSDTDSYETFSQSFAINDYK